MNVRTVLLAGIAQPDLFRDGRRWPNVGTQHHDILLFLQRGGRLTVKTAMDELGVYALSQRCGELRRKYGWPIQSETKQVGPKTYVSEYWL